MREQLQQIRIKLLHILQLLSDNREQNNYYAHVAHFMLPTLVSDVLHDVEELLKLGDS